MLITHKYGLTTSQSSPAHNPVSAVLRPAAILFLNHSCMLKKSFSVINECVTFYMCINIFLVKKKLYAFETSEHLNFLVPTRLGANRLDAKNLSA